MSKETEKIFSQMNKYMEQFNFDNEEQMEKEMKNFIQKLNNNEIEFDDDPKFQSDDLLEEAYNTSSKTKAIKLAKQALEINPENIDAECFIAEFEENQIKKLSKMENIIEKAIQNVKMANEALLNGMPIDIITIYIKQILDDLGEITGDCVTEDIINEIFSKFCLGK